MPVQYIGRKTFYHGKTLYGIARNFKNFGVGRMVQRYNFFRYEEPSYYILTKVEPDMTCPKMEKGIAYGVRVFRGENMGEKKIDAGGRRDWRLVPKEDEAELIKLAENTPSRVKNVIDPVVTLPPLMEELLIQEMKNEGIESPRPIVLKTKIENKANNYAVLGES